ncbi:MAG: V-type ATPase subunit [Clostridia bacterium]|nr:V-type ATPase subunit [Clostridia bacterium]
MRETDYAYAVAYTHTLENRMLKKADYDSLLGMGSFAEAVRFLADKGWGGAGWQMEAAGALSQNESMDAAPKEHNTDADAMLKAEQAYIWSEVKNACPKDAPDATVLPFNILLYQNDFHNLKTILKAVFSGAAFRPLMLEPNTVSPEAMHQAIAAGKPDALPEPFKTPAAEAYRALAREEDGQFAEIILDKALFNAMKEIAEETNSDFLVGWMDLNIALMNMKIALRGSYGGKSKEFLRAAMLNCKRINADALAEAAGREVPAVVQVFANSGFDDAAKAAQVSPAAFERWCDNRMIKHAQLTRYKTFGFEPILGFLVLKQFELQAVRIILSGLRGGVPAEVLRGRMRDLHD